MSTVRRALLSALLVSSVLLCGGASLAEERAGRRVDPATVTGCCACRASRAGGFAVRSCADGKRVADCVQKCQGEGAASLVFGHGQTCAQGCAGFSTAGH
jgi:hypothetical protein